MLEIELNTRGGGGVRNIDDIKRIGGELGCGATIDRR